MGRRIEMTAEEKEVLILECLAGRLRMREAARRAGVGHSTMHFWISRYRSEGRAALAEDGNQSKRSYSRGVFVWPGQQHGHRGTVQAAVWKSCIGVGKGVSSP